MGECALVFSKFARAIGITELMPSPCRLEENVNEWQRQFLFTYICELLDTPLGVKTGCISVHEGIRSDVSIYLTRLDPASE